MFGPCKVCEEKDKRIVDLQAQIKTLTSLVAPTGHVLNPVVPEVHIEADRALSGSDQVSDYQRLQILESEEVMAEANAILTGSY
jgi:hypothetical protein